MSRTNKSRHRWSHGYVSNHLRWEQRHERKVHRRWARQQLPLLSVSVFEQLLEDIAADRLEAHGALEQAMRLRNPVEPDLR
ncbi:MAG: hypothetical protein DI536_22760 [Archangium gephyra]|uniref:Uncharacterized protein n=1 Tax=Archangium gephyra TaxID=48 RepID=A0A2W5VGG5_9BACT|nr:MAG: hypothetical protein DI536_22760 [Archangium gephyra]